ncbi:hypothetical protein Tco_0804143 [Tanacetum coccineum]|uniref:Transposase (Putative), gypsy type n=1 Tax=Tanacetum coccineum TaxID=301880 RepID=A0ABQ5A4F2_9ASTR
MNKFSKHNVYSTRKILGVKSVNVKKLHGYGHLEEVVVKRADRQLYKFKEGDFVDLHLNDIEDMLLLDVQHKLFHLNESDIVDFIVALRMFTRSLIIKRRVRDLQLRVESYQNKLIITVPKQTFLEIEFKELYTSSYKPPGFLDGTLKKVRDELHHRILDFCLGYNDEMSKRKWTDIDKKRTELMVELIDKQMRERRIIRNLERLVGARNTNKSVSKDPFPKSFDFNTEHYATLVAYSAPFHKYPEPFLFLIGISRNYTLDEDTYPQFLRENDEEIDLLSFIQTADPTKVRVGERQRAEGEPKLLHTTVGRVVPLLPIAPARAGSELDASVDKLFDEGGSGNLAEQGDSASGGHGVGIQRVSEAAETVVEDASPVQPRRQRKIKTIVSDADEPLHPPKKLREDHETPTTACGKSRSAVQRLLIRVVQNAEVRDEPIPTLPFVTSSVSTILEREDKDSSHHSDANIEEAEVDSFARPSVPLMTAATTVTSTVDPATTVKEKFVESSVFSGNSSGGGADHIVGGFSDLTSSDFIVGGVRTVVSPHTDLQKVYVPQWSVTNSSCLDDGHTCRKMMDEFAPPKFFASIRGEKFVACEGGKKLQRPSVSVPKPLSSKVVWNMTTFFTEFNVGAARQMSLSAEVRMCAEYNIIKRSRLNSVEKNLLLVKEAKAAEAIRLCAEASKFEVVEKSLRDEVKVLEEQNAALEQKNGDLGVKVADLAASFKVREQEVADLDAQVTFAKSQGDNLADRVHELETSSIGLQEKVTAYENFIDQLEKFQDEKMREVNEKFDKLCADFVEMALHLEEKFYSHLLTTISGRQWLLTHGMKLAKTKCLNSTEYLSTLGEAIGKAVEKDASVDTIMNLLCLEDTLAERLGLTESQPHVNQLMVPIHHSPDQRVIGASALSLSLDPLSAAALEGTEGTSGAAPDTTTALSVTFVSVSTIPPISTEDYEVAHADGQESAGADGQAVVHENVNPFPNIDDAELNVPE